MKGIPKLDAFRLKTIAAASMLVDHTAAAFPETFPLWFRAMGRLAWPLFAFLLAESLSHTKNETKLLLKLAVFAFVSQVPYNVALRGSGLARAFTHTYGLNIFFTLLLGAVASVALKKLFSLRETAAVPSADEDAGRGTATWRRGSFHTHEKIAFVLTAAAVLAIFSEATGLSFDYGLLGILSIAILSMLTNKKSKLAFMAFFALMQFSGAFVFLLESTARGIPPSEASANFLSVLPAMTAMTLVSVFLASLHDGSRGKSAKWAFYVFYPLHLSVLAAFVMLG